MQPPKPNIESLTKVRRPTVEFNRKTFEELCKIQCTNEEISSVIGISIQTILLRCQEIYGVTFEEENRQYRSEIISTTAIFDQAYRNQQDCQSESECLKEVRDRLFALGIREDVSYVARSANA